MSRFTVKPGKLEIAAVLAPLAMAFAVVTMPVQSDNSDDMPPMTFDSVGSMLQDMDREQSLCVMERHTGLPTTDHKTDHSCQTADVNARMDEVYTRLKTRVESIDLSEIAELETQIVMQRAREIEITRQQQKALVRQAQARAEAANAGIKAAIAEMEQHRRQSASKEAEMVAATVEAALRAAEAALENQP